MRADFCYRAWEFSCAAAGYYRRCWYAAALPLSTRFPQVIEDQDSERTTSLSCQSINRTLTTLHPDRERICHPQSCGRFHEILMCSPGPGGGLPLQIFPTCVFGVFIHFENGESTARSGCMHGHVHAGDGSCRLLTIVFPDSPQPELVFTPVERFPGPVLAGQHWGNVGDNGPSTRVSRQLRAKSLLRDSRAICRWCALPE